MTALERRTRVKAMRARGERRRWTLAGLLLAALAAGAPGPAAASGGVASHAAPRRSRATAPRPVSPSASAGRAVWFRRSWGIEVVGVRRVSSGYMLRFDYRVVDPEKAAALGDKSARPYLLDEATGIALSVPAMENVGELRQTGPAQPDRTYFMIFGNPGGLVKRGGRVTLVVGNLRARGLVVDESVRLAGATP